MHLGVFPEQALVQFAAVELQARRLQAEEADLAVDQVARHVQRVVAEEGSQRPFVAVRVVHVEQGFDAAVGAAAAGVKLVELAHPLAALADGVAVADGKGKQGLQLADAQVGPQ